MTDDNYNGYPHLVMMDGCAEVEWYKDAIGVPDSLGERNMTFCETAFLTQPRHAGDASTTYLCSIRTAPSPVLVSVVRILMSPAGTADAVPGRSFPPLKQPTSVQTNPFMVLYGCPSPVRSERATAAIDKYARLLYQLICRHISGRMGFHQTTSSLVLQLLTHLILSISTSQLTSADQNENMSTSKNQAAWLQKANTPLEVGDAPLYKAGAGEIVVKNAAVAINPLDCHMQDAGVFVQQWPTVFGCDVAGEVHELGSGVNRFKKGDRVIG